jgi:16S rRNA processing protein RimM
MSNGLILVGRVARTHGNKGQVIVNPETDFAELRFRRGQVLLVGPEHSPVPREIRDVRFQQGRPIVAFEGIGSMDDAEALAGAELWVEAGSLQELPAHTYYHYDLVGCQVLDRGGRPVGTVTAIEGPMERSHLVVQGPRGEVMIPMAAGMVTVDLPSKRIVVDPPEGLLELNEKGGGVAGER